MKSMFLPWSRKVDGMWKQIHSLKVIQTGIDTTHSDIVWLNRLKFVNNTIVIPNKPLLHLE